MVDADRGEEEREQRIDHNHAEYRQDHGCRCPGPDSGGATLRGQALAAGNKSDCERQERVLMRPAKKLLAVIAAVVART